MKKNNLYIVPGIVVLVLVFGGLLYFGHSVATRERQVKEALNQMPEVGDIVVNGNTCYNRPNYLVVSRPDLNGNAGEDILVKFKTDKNEKFKCEYLVGKNDLELLNTPASDVPTFFYDQHVSFLKDNSLIMNLRIEGNRSFIIYDLFKKENVYRDIYSTDLLDLKENTLSYWRKTNDIPNIENCAKVEEYNKVGGAKIEGEIALNLKNLSDKKWSNFKCSAVE